MSEISVCMLGCYQCKTVWSEESLTLTILAGTTAWAGTLEQRACKEVGVLGDTWDMAREAFRGVNQEKYDFTVQEKTLTWRKVGGKAKIKILEIPLNTVSFLDAQKEMFAYLVESNKELTDKNKDFKRRQDNLARDLKKSKNMLIQLEKEKSKIEDSMYARFLPILNSKKEKILELEKYGPKTVHAMSEDEDDDYGGDTDEDPNETEDNIEEPDRKRSKIVMDDSLGLLDDSLSLL